MRQRGVTLVEMLIVVTIAGIIGGISLPSLTTGLDTLRLASASNSVVGFLNSALNRAERRQQPIEVTVSTRDNTMTLRSTDAGFERKLTLPDGIRIDAVLPKPPSETDEDRRFLLLPGGTVPRFGIELASQRGARRIVSVDPITGVPHIVRPEEER